MNTSKTSVVANKAFVALFEGDEDAANRWLKANPGAATRTTPSPTRRVVYRVVYRPKSETQKRSGLASAARSGSPHWLAAQRAAQRQYGDMGAVAARTLGNALGGNR